MIPTSISKSINAADSMESSINARDRSSNSISSCEMALNSSQNGDDNSNDNNTTRKNETTGESTSVTNEVTKNASVVDNIRKHGAHNKDCKSENEVPKNCDGSRMAISETSYNVHECNAAAVEASAYNKEQFAKPCLSLDDILSCSYEETEKKQRTSSICSYPEEYLFTKDTVLRKRLNSDSK